MSEDRTPPRGGSSVTMGRDRKPAWADSRSSNPVEDLREMYRKAGLPLRPIQEDAGQFIQQLNMEKHYWKLRAAIAEARLIELEGPEAFTAWKEKYNRLDPDEGER